MPRTINADGRTITVPDDATSEEINEIVGPAPSAAPTGNLRSLTERERFTNPELYPVGAKGEGIGENLKNLAQRGGVGVFQLADALANPRRTAAGMLSSVLPEPVVRGVNKVVDLENQISGMHYLTTKLPEGTPNPVESSYQAVAPGGMQAAGNVAPTVGQLIAGGALSEIAGAVREDTPAAAGKTARFLTKTTPEVTKNLVKETKAANEVATTKAAEETAKQQAKHTENVAKSEEERKVDLRKHFEKTQAAKESNVQAEAPASRKVALERGVEQLDTQFQDDLKQTELQVRKQAGAKYDDVRAKVGSATVPNDTLASAVKQAESNISGSSENIKIFRDILSKYPEGEPEFVEYEGAQIPKGHPLYEVLKEQGGISSAPPASFSDLQGYYSELGKSLAKGNLPDDVFRAIRDLHSDIGNMMQKMATDAGAGPQFADARNFYRQYMEAFRDHKSPLYKAIKASERGKSIASLSGKDQTGIETLARYNPELAQRANTIRGYQAEAKSIPAKPKALKSLPKLEPKPPTPEAPPPVRPELGKVGPEEIRGAKLKSLEQRAGKIRSRGEWIASGAAGYRALSSILHGNLGAVPADLLEGGIAIAGVEGISRLLENPKVVEFLTRPTPGDLAQIPPELRGDMGQIAQIAARKGIQVDPRIYAAVGASTRPRKNVAAALQPQ